ncbi:MAG: DUF177 domain-containing protein [Gemmatimonadota bacterium]|nr:DUF177 domain-containing protein [Gemmatimonadota bacterium]
MVGAIPMEDPRWEDSGFVFLGPVAVDLRATIAGSGELVLRGGVKAPIQQECRRCLEPVEAGLDTEIAMVFVPADTHEDGDDGEVRTFDAGAAELELSEPVREEILLSIDPYVVCDPECKGLCPKCGANLNTEVCDCVSSELDPRWDALRSLHRE